MTVNELKQQLENIEADFGNAQIIFYFEHDGYGQRADSMFFEILPLSTKLVPTITTCLDEQDTKDHEKAYSWKNWQKMREYLER